MTYRMIFLSLGTTEFFKHVIMEVHPFVIQITKADELGCRALGDGAGVQLSQKYQLKQIGDWGRGDETDRLTLAR